MQFSSSLISFFSILFRKTVRKKKRTDLTCHKSQSEGTFLGTFSVPLPIFTQKVLKDLSFYSLKLRDYLIFMWSATQKWLHVPINVAFSSEYRPHPLKAYTVIVCVSFRCKRTLNGLKTVGTVVFT